MKLKFIYFFVTLACLIWLVLSFSQNETPVDSGDGLMHFYIAQASWFDSKYFLDHWGKPLFIFFSSPFAQFGFKGMFAFNLLCYLIISWLGYLISKQMKINLGCVLLFPPLLLNSYDFSFTLLAGLTEPLFNVFLMLCVYLLLSKKSTLFAISLSLLPFLRSEGQLIFILGFFYLIFSKNFKSIVYLFIPPVIYFSLGFLILDDFWWYFNRNPYSFNNNIYGHGEWNHYISQFRSFYGTLPIFISIVSILSIVFFIRKKQWGSLFLKESLFVLFCFFGIIFIHSVLWYFGKFGAFGLIRLATQGMPLFLIFSLYFFEQTIVLYFVKIKYIIVPFLIFLSFYVIIFKNIPPLKKPPFDKKIEACAKYMEQHKSDYHKIHYHDPLFPYYMKLNPFIDTARIHFYYAQNIENDFNSIIKEGDIVLWDSRFGPREFGLSFNKLNHLKKLKPYKSFLLNNADNKKEGVICSIYKK